MNFFEFADQHIGAVIVAMIMVFLIVGTSLCILLYQAVRKGMSFGWKDGKVEIATKGDLNQATKSAANLYISMTTVQNNIKQAVEALRSKTSGELIRSASMRIEDGANLVRQFFWNNINEKFGSKTAEGNYQRIIFQFVSTEVENKIKTEIFNAIRNDHFEEKTSEDLQFIEDSVAKRACSVLSDNITNGNALDQELIEKAIKKYEPLVRTMTSEIMKQSAELYKETHEKQDGVIEKGLNELIMITQNYGLEETQVEGIIADLKAQAEALKY